MNKSQGFTLLELIVVLAIFAVFAAMAYGGLNHVLRSRQQIEQALNRNAEWQKGFLRLRNDLQLIVPRLSRDVYGQASPALRFDPFQAQLSFTHAGLRNPLNRPRSGSARIGYRLDVSQKQLIRDTWQTQDPTEVPPESVVVLEAVEGFSAEFLARDATGEAVWRQTWPLQTSTVGAPSAELPKAIKIIINSKDFGEVTWLFATGASVAKP